MLLGHPDMIGLNPHVLKDTIAPLPNKPIKASRDMPPYRGAAAGHTVRIQVR